jgi:hypothetical protein
VSATSASTSLHTFALLRLQCHEALCGHIYYQAILPVVLHTFAHTSDVPIVKLPQPTRMLETRDTSQANAHTVKMLQPPTAPNSRPLSIMTTGTSATQADHTGETWKMNVTEHNCWDDLILTLGM